MSIGDLIRDTKSLEKQIEDLQKRLTENRNEIQKYFDKKKIKRFEVEADDVHKIPLYAMKIERAYINYLVDKLKEKLSKETFKKIVNKTYQITDIEGLKPLLQKAEIQASDFKKYISVIESPNKDAIKQLYSVGEITQEDLKGCYDAKIVKSIEIKEEKGGTN